MIAAQFIINSHKSILTVANHALFLIEISQDLFNKTKQNE